MGALPQGFPPLTIRPVSACPISRSCSEGAVGIALVALADTIATASAFADRTGQDVDGSQEMIGVGAANIAAGLFQGFPVSTSGSRTAVAEQVGREDTGHRAGGRSRDHVDAPVRAGAVAEPA